MPNERKSYIEVSGMCCYARELHPVDLWAIGDFTRENIAKWVDDSGPYGFDDFHAVSGDIDIPWETESGKQTGAWLASSCKEVTG